MKPGALHDIEKFAQSLREKAEIEKPDEKTENSEE